MFKEQRNRIMTSNNKKRGKLNLEKEDTKKLGRTVSLEFGSGKFYLE